MYRVIIAGMMILSAFFLSELLPAEELSFKILVEKLSENSCEYQKSILQLEQAAAGYKEGRAGLMPALSFSVPVSYSQTSRTAIPNFPQGTEFLDGKIVSLNPEFTVSQYLPTGGTLGLSMSSDFSITHPGSLNDESFSSSLNLDSVYKYTPGISVSFSQPVVFENVYGAAVTLIEENWVIARSNFVISKNLLIYNLVESCYNLLYLARTVLIMKTGLNNIENNYAEAEKSFKAGRLSQVMLLKAEAELRKGRIDLSASEEAFSQNIAGFCNKYGVAQEEAVAFFSAEDFDRKALIQGLNLSQAVLALEVITEKAFQSNMELMIARKRKTLSQAGLVQARAKEAPLLSLGTGLFFGDLGGEHKNAGEAISAPFSEEDGNLSVSVNLTLSGRIFDGGAGSHRIKQAAGNLKQSLLDLEQKEKDIRQGAEVLWKKIAQSSEKMEYRKLNFEIASFEYEKGQKDYLSGIISQVNLTALKLNFESSVLEYIKSEMEYTLSRLELLMFTGEDLEVIIVGEQNHDQE